MRLARETWLLLALGLLDLASTVWLLCRGVAWEANPIMYWYLERGGLGIFCAVKALLMVCPLAILEWVRRVDPNLGLWALRFALAGYVLLYSVMVWRANEQYLRNVFTSRLPQVSRSWQQREIGGNQRVPSPNIRAPMVIPLGQDSLVAPH